MAALALPGLLLSLGLSSLAQAFSFLDAKLADLGGNCFRIQEVCSLKTESNFEID